MRSKDLFYNTREKSSEISRNTKEDKLLTKHRNFLIKMKFSFSLPHPKDGGRQCFHRCVSVHKGGEYSSPRFFSRSLAPGPFWMGTPVIGSFPGHWSQVLSGGVPQSQVLSRSLVPGPFWRDTPVPVPGSFPGHGSQVLSREGVPQPGQDGYSPQPGQDGVPPLWPGQRYPPPCPTG